MKFQLKFKTCCEIYNCSRVDVWHLETGDNLKVSTNNLLLIIKMYIIIVCCCDIYWPTMLSILLSLQVKIGNSLAAFQRKQSLLKMTVNGNNSAEANSSSKTQTKKLKKSMSKQEIIDVRKNHYG